MATKTTNPAASAATTTTKDTNFTTEKAEVENPEQTLTLTPPDASAPDSLAPSQQKPHPSAGDSEAVTNGADPKAKETESGSSPPSNDVEKKIRRAERFGVPVKLSEQEKRNSRAERFGTVTGSDGAKSSEDLKRKARADRFSLAANPPAAAAAAATTTTTTDEDARKKARLARFGSNVKVDSQEEEKRKARALRFAKASESPNEKQKVETEAVAAGNTAGAT